MGVDFLYLNEKDMIQAGVGNMEKCMYSMEDMFVLLRNGDYRMGGISANDHGIMVTFPKKSEIPQMPLNKPDYRFMAMPAYLGGRFHAFGIKSYGSNPNNHAIGLPRSILMFSLLDVETGVPVAYMSANILSAMRTGAVSGLGAKYLCSKKVTTVAIIGPGTMSRYAMKAFMKVQPDINCINIKGRGQQNIDCFIEFCRENYSRIEKFNVCDTIEEACINADIVFLGNTNARRFDDNPYIKYEWLKKGTTVISVSSLLLDPTFLSASDVKVITDYYKQYEARGDGQPMPTQQSVSSVLGMGLYDAVTEGKIKKERIIDIGDVILGEKTGRNDDKQIVLYAVGGMPVEDVAWGYDVYQNACRNNIGLSLNLWDDPKV